MKLATGAPQLSIEPFAARPSQPALRRRQSWPLATLERDVMCASQGLSRGPVIGEAADLTRLLPPRPRWRALTPVEQPPLPLVEVASQPQEVVEHLDEIVARAQAMSPTGSLTAPIQWLKIRPQVKVGMAMFRPASGEGADDLSYRIVFKQIGSRGEGTSRTFLQERAWLRGLPKSTQCPTLLASCAQSSLLVMRHVQGDMVPPVLYDEVKHRWVAKALATVHAAPLNSEMLAIRGERRFPWSLENWLPFVRHVKRISEPAFDNLFFLRNLIVGQLDSLPAVRKAIHGDPMPNNILVDESKQSVALIDYGYAACGDPMFDLAFFAVSIHLPLDKTLGLLGPYHASQRELSVPIEPSDAQRLGLYVLYQRLFRHVASHKEYVSGKEDQYDRWLSRLFDDVTLAQDRGWLTLPKKPLLFFRDV